MPDVEALRQISYHKPRQHDIQGEHLQDGMEKLNNASFQLCHKHTNIWPQKIMSRDTSDQMLTWKDESCQDIRLTDC